MPSSNTPSHTPRKPTPRQLRYLRILADQTGTTFTYPTSFGDAKRLIDQMKNRKRTPRADIRRERLEVSRDMATRRGDNAQVTPDELTGYGSTATWTPDAGEQPGPRVVHCENEPFDIYCGRGSRKLGLAPSKWANPFRVGPDGTREQIIAKHKHWILNQPQLLASLEELRGQTLGCHCAPEACHCDTLIELANTPRPVTPTADTPRKGKPHALAGYQVNQERRLIVVQRINGLIRVGDLPANGKGRRYLVADHLTTYGELNDLLLDYTHQIAKLGAVTARPCVAHRDA